MKLPAPIAAIALLSASALALAGCATTTDNAQGDVQHETLRVVATTTQLADFASIIGGDEIELTGLLAAGGSAHHFDPSPADLIALGSADVLIVNGAGLDEFIESAVDAAGFSGTVIDASEGIDLALATEITLEALDGAPHDHNHEGEHESEEADAHAHEGDHDHADHGHDHDHGDLNPHLWTSPRFAQGMAHEIGHGLAEADPANAELFEQRAHDYMHELEELDVWVAAQFERVPGEQRVLVTGHDSLRYYLHDYGIAYAGSLLQSFEDNAEPSAAEIDALIEAINESGVRAIFVESSLSPKLAQTVAAEAGVIVVDEALLYVDSLGAKGSGAEDYVSATVHNTRVILDAWGFETELPMAG